MPGGELRPRPAPVRVGSAGSLPQVRASPSAVALSTLSLTPSPSRRRTGLMSITAQSRFSDEQDGLSDAAWAHRSASDALGQSLSGMLSRESTWRPSSRAATATGVGIGGRTSSHARSLRPVASVQDFRRQQHEIQERSGATSSSGPRPPSRLGASCPGPSTPTRIENSAQDWLWEQLAARLEQSQVDATGTTPARTGGRGRLAAGAGGSTADVSVISGDAVTLEKESAAMSKALQEELRLVDSSLDSMFKSLRMENFSATGADEERLEREREAERQRKLAEQREMRKREQAARAPAHKVKLKIERSRDFPESNAAKVPLQTMEVQGGKGVERVTLVDLRAVWNKCTQMGGAISVRSLLEAQKIKDKWQRSQSWSRRPNHTLTSVSSCGGLSHSGTLRLPQGSPFDTGLSEEGALLDALQESPGITDNGTPDGSPQGSPQRSPQGTPFSKTTILRTPGTAGSRVSFLQAAERMDRARTLPPRSSRLSVTPNMTPQRSKGSVAVPDSAGSSVRRPSRRLTVGSGAAASKTPVRQEGGAQKQQRVRHLWVVLQASSKWLLLQRIIRSRHQASKVVKHWITNMGEWARLRKSVKRMVDAVKMLQQRARSFLTLKKKRTDGLERMWQTIEDKHLASFFNTYAKKMAQERVGEQEAQLANSRTRDQAKIRRQLDEFHASGEHAFKAADHMDWKNYRIPPKERKLMIRRYYMEQLRKRVRSQSSLTACVHELISAQRDLVSYLNSYGSGEDFRPYMRKVLETGEQITQEEAGTVAANWWSMSEQVVLELIGISAKMLSQSEQEPFLGHPANKDLPGNPLYCRTNLNSFRMCNVDVRNPRKKLAASSKPQEGGTPSTARAPTDAVRRSGATTVVASESEDKREERREDLEDLFRGFTPRLRAITDQQQQRYLAKKIGKLDAT